MSTGRSERKATMEQQLAWLGWELGGKRKAMEIAVAMLYNTVKAEIARSEAAIKAAADAAPKENAGHSEEAKA